MKYFLPDYDHSLLSLMSSIRKFFNVEVKHKSLENVDTILNSNKYRSVVVILMDGMGTRIIDKHLDEHSFMRTHLMDELSSTFPATTVAATTTVRTGNSPIENGWLGWHQYFDEIKDDINLFIGNAYYDESRTYNKKIAYKLLPYKNIFELIREQGFKADEIFPAWGEANPTEKFDQCINKIIKFAHEGNDKQYLYCYWDQPDHDLHDLGTDHPSIRKMLKKFDSLFKKLEKNLPDDAICFVVADHGHLNIKELNLIDYPDFLDTLERLPSIEPRNCSFFVREGKKEEFLKLFDKYFKDKFLLFSKEEVIEKGLFGKTTKDNPHLRFIGDYQACSISEYALMYNPTHEPIFKAAHAGITEGEMLVPLIKITKK